MQPEAVGGAVNKRTTADVVPKSWGNLGGLAIDLDDLSLGGRAQKKNAVPMNAMKTSSPSPAGSSSNESPMSPSRGGVAPFPGPPATKQQSNNNNLLNDLL